MTRDRFYELGQFFGGYFHQDWREDASDWRSVVQGYLEIESPGRIRAVATQMGKLLSMDLEEARLGRTMSDLGNDSSPPPGMTHREWLYAMHGMFKEAVAKNRRR